MEKELALKIKIPNYPRKVLLSKSIRAKYFSPNDRLARKYITYVAPPQDTLLIKARNKQGGRCYLNAEYIWRKVGPKYRLHHVATKTDILKNPTKAGQEKWKIIKGQDMYSQMIDEFTRAKIVTTLKEFWLTQLKQLVPTPSPFSLQGLRYPVYITFEYCATIDDRSDLDNYSLPYHKTLLDALVMHGIIEGDTVRYVAGIKILHTPPETREGTMEEITANWGKQVEEAIVVIIHATKQ